MAQADTRRRAAGGAEEVQAVLVCIEVSPLIALAGILAAVVAHQLRRHRHRH